MYVHFMILAPRWKKLISCWEDNEWLLLQEIDSHYDPNRLRRKSRKMIVIFFVLGIISHTLERLANYRQTTECWGFTSRIHAYFNQSFPELFALLPYSEAVAYCALTASLICEFTRTYLDVFLSTICMAIREQFEILNNRILTTPISVRKLS